MMVVCLSSWWVIVFGRIIKVLMSSRFMMCIDIIMVMVVSMVSRRFRLSIGSLMVCVYLGLLVMVNSCGVSVRVSIVISCLFLSVIFMVVIWFILCLVACIRMLLRRVLRW